MTGLFAERESDCAPDGDALSGYARLLSGIVGVLEQARTAAVRSVNAVMTATYWSIGYSIVEQELRGKERAGYGEELMARLAVDLTAKFGRGFGQRNLYQMRQFRLAWPPETILQTLSAKSSKQQILQIPSAKLPVVVFGDGESVDLGMLAQAFPLPWSAYVKLLSARSPEARRFYETEAIRNGWTVKQLNRQINSLFYERTALSRDKAAMLLRGSDAVVGDAVIAEESVKDPLVLEFLGLKDEYSETDLEDALITHLTDFLLELGDDFAFIARQRRLRLDDSWFRVDLVLFNRRLRCLVLVDLKLGKFSYQDAGQMTLYLNYAKQHWVKPGENPPAGIILCSGKGTDEVRYSLDGLGNAILATEYRLALPDEKLLEAELAATRIHF
ncbi:MAG: PDDEXK nuclease domain-containing protein, partial [Propionibacteriaceae bacterium]|nr:PDDEXK nuclease domain-containing protein [Propionibacteriaceae bacterium]